MLPALARASSRAGSGGCGQGGYDPVGEPVGPAVAAGAGELDGSSRPAAASSAWVGQRSSSRSTAAPQIAAGDVERGGEDGLQVGAQPVDQPALVAGGAFVVAGDGAQFPAELAVRDQRLEPGVPVQREQAADPGVLGVVLLLRRAAAAGDQVRVDRQHGEPGVDQAPRPAARGGSPAPPAPRPGRAPGAGSGPTSRATPSGPCSIRNCSITPFSGGPNATSWNSSAQSMPTPSTSPPPVVPTDVPADREGAASC